MHTGRWLLLKTHDMFLELERTIGQLSSIQITNKRQVLLDPILEYAQRSMRQNNKIHLNFICTHNSRRSQLAQAWAYAMAAHFEVPIAVFSGGVEVTGFYPAAVKTLINQGFKITTGEGLNPEYKLKTSADDQGLVMKSKIFDDPINQCDQFAAIMVCDHADQNCPFIPNAERFSLPFQDPKISDGTTEQAAVYAQRSLEIGAEMLYLFSNIK
jgi:arsenate reductase (thioredoxin)